MDDLVVTPALTIPGAELELRTMRSSGPGGQGVNTTDSKVELRWNVAESAVLSDSLRDRLLARLDTTQAGEVTVRADSTRSQHRNRAEARSRLKAMLLEALRPPPKRRRPTTPSRGAKRRRLEQKKQRGEIKKLRRKPDW